MHYFTYQSSKPMGNVWELFRELGDMDDKRLAQLQEFDSYSHTLEIVNAAMNGSLTPEMTNRGFDLTAYEFKCAENDRKADFSKYKKVVNIVETSSSDSDVNVGYGNVSDRNLPAVEDALDTLFEEDDFYRNLSTLYSIRSKYVRERGVDLCGLLYNALKGIPEAVMEMRDLMFKDSKVKELFVSLCEGSSDGSLLKELSAVVA